MQKRMAVGAALICALIASCGEPSDSLDCGPGTMEVNGVCQITEGSAGDAGLGGTGGSDSTGSSTNGSADSGGTAGDTGGNGGSGGTDDTNTSGDTTTNSNGGSGTTASAGGSTASGGSGSDSGGASGNTGGGAGGDGSVGAGGNTGGAGGNTTDGGGSGGTGGGGDISTEPFDCGSRNVTGATEVEGTIGEDATWSGLIHVVGDVSVRNEATLTIEPGTKIIVGLDHTIDFGWENSHPTLIAEGTPEAPILFCGETDTPGYWEALSIQAGVNPESVLRNVLIQEAGATTAALVVNAPVLLEGVQVVDSGTVGVEASAFGANSTVLSVHNSGEYAGRVTSKQATDWPDKLDFTGNAFDRIHIAFTDLSESVYFEARGAGFVQDRLFALSDAGAGVTVRIGPGIAYDNSVGLELQEATISVEGTEAEPVTFAGSVVVSNGSIRHATVSRAGTLAAIFALWGPVVLEDVGFDNLQLIDDGSLAPGSSGLRTIESKTSITFMTPSCAAVNALPPDTEISADALIQLKCELDSEPVSLINVGGEYDLRDSDAASVGSGESLSIEAGVVVRLTAFGVASGGSVTIEPGARLRLQSIVDLRGSFSAQGEPDDPVVFEGSWLGCNVHEGSSVTIDHALFDGVGDGEVVPPSAALKLYAPATVTNTTIQNSDVWGLLHTEEDTTDYSVSNTFINNAQGDIGTF